MGCGNSKPSLDSSVYMCLEMLDKRPHEVDFVQKFRAKAHQTRTMEELYASTVFGGSLFTPVGTSLKRGLQRDRHNNLRNEVCAQHIDYLYGGGYYVIHNVKRHRQTSGDQEPTNEYVDIYLLIDRVEQVREFLSRHIQRVEAEKPNTEHDTGRRVSTKKGDNIVTKETDAALQTSPIHVRKFQGHRDFFFDEIAPFLNGYGRLVHFTCHKDLGNPLDLELTSIEEGRIAQGELDGYGRRFNLTHMEELIEVGFFRHGVPLGKYHSFTKNGDTKEQGIRDGDDLVKKVEIKDFMTRNLGSDLGQLETGVALDK